jgi:hypothetical protein
MEQVKNQTKLSEEAWEKASILTPAEVVGKVVTALASRKPLPDRVDYAAMLNIPLSDPELK